MQILDGAKFVLTGLSVLNGGNMSRPDCKFWTFQHLHIWFLQCFRYVYCIVEMLGPPPLGASQIQTWALCAMTKFRFPAVQ